MSVYDTLAGPAACRAACLAGLYERWLALAAFRRNSFPRCVCCGWRAVYRSVDVIDACTGTRPAMSKSIPPSIILDAVRCR
ncbi:TPA: hypothetical protein ACYLM8_005994, partial [Burkholderia lata]